ncbi:MAG: hypothetical protein IPM27_05690 [Nitrosomonadales bacterium]|nr:hypothetical protein [Nitrosomonadales bacterium]
MNKWILGIILASTPYIACAAETSGINAKFNQLFKGVDTDANGKISRDEAIAGAPAMAENFDAIDANHDDALSKKEIKAFNAALNKKRHEFSQRLEKADKDKNGMLSRQEAKALPNLDARFDEIDGNHDEQLVIKEISDYLRGKTGNGNGGDSAATVRQ